MQPTEASSLLGLMIQGVGVTLLALLCQVSLPGVPEPLAVPVSYGVAGFRLASRWSRRSRLPTLPGTGTGARAGPGSRRSRAGAAR
jgi:hypothetical protein